MIDHTCAGLPQDSAYSPSHRGIVLTVLHHTICTTCISLATSLVSSQYDSDDDDTCSSEVVTSASISVDNLGKASAVATSQVPKHLQMPNMSVNASVKLHPVLMASASATIPLGNILQSHCNSTSQTFHNETGLQVHTCTHAPEVSTVGPRQSQVPTEGPNVQAIGDSQPQVIIEESLGGSQVPMEQAGPLQLGVAQTPAAERSHVPTCEGRSLVRNDGTSQLGGLSCHTSGSSDKSSFYFDKLNRKHYIIPYTGPAVVCVRAGKFYSSTSLTHVVDLTHILKAVVMEQRTAVTLLVDGGPDWNTSSLLNCLFFYRLWRDVGLDMLVVRSYAARCSSYNPIEHLWAPLSKRLSGVQFSAVASGDRKPPCQLSGITAQERKQKEAMVFDNAINELCSVHWANATFDGYPCHSFHIRCLDDKPPIYDDHEFEDIQSFLRCPLRDIKAGKYKEIALEMKAMLKHIMRYRNEVISHYQMSRHRLFSLQAASYSG